MDAPRNLFMVGHNLAAEADREAAAHLFGNFTAHLAVALAAALSCAAALMLLVSELAALNAKFACGVV